MFMIIFIIIMLYEMAYWCFSSSIKTTKKSFFFLAFKGTYAIIFESNECRYLILLLSFYFVISILAQE